MMHYREQSLCLAHLRWVESGHLSRELVRATAVGARRLESQVESADIQLPWRRGSELNANRTPTSRAECLLRLIPLRGEFRCDAFGHSAPSSQRGRPSADTALSWAGR